MPWRAWLYWKCFKDSIYTKYVCQYYATVFKVINKRKLEFETSLKFIYTVLSVGYTGKNLQDCVEVSNSYCVENSDYCN